MDFATRDRYRHVVETLARHADLSEEEVARRAMELAVDRRMRLGGADRSTRVGYCLTPAACPTPAGGRVRPRPRSGSGGWRQAPLPLYLGGIAVIAGIITAAGGTWAAMAGLPLAALAIFVRCSSSPRTRRRSRSSTGLRC